VGLGDPPVAFFNTLVNAGVTAQGAPWLASGSASSAAQVSAVFQYVTPIAIQTTLPELASLTGFGVLTLHFVPEPSTALLLGAGVAWLAVAGRRRTRA
jgi:PEP-CTERM motif